jgi:hypothetical protein
MDEEEDANFVETRPPLPFDINGISRSQLEPLYNWIREGPVNFDSCRVSTTMRLSDNLLSALLWAPARFSSAIDMPPVHMGPSDLSPANFACHVPPRLPSSSNSSPVACSIQLGALGQLQEIASTSADDVDPPPSAATQPRHPSRQVLQPRKSTHSMNAGVVHVVTSIDNCLPQAPPIGCVIQTATHICFSLFARADTPDENITIELEEFRVASDILLCSHHSALCTHACGYDYVCVFACLFVCWEIVSTSPMPHAGSSQYRAGRL